jgi:HSP20 family protein
MTLVKRTNDLFPSFFGDLFDTDFFGGTTAHTGMNIPAVNIKETPESYEIEMSVAGMKKDDFNIDLDRNVIKISSEKSEESTEENKDENYTRKEFSYTSFSRSFVLPEAANREDIKATYEDGILKVFIAKKDEAKLLPKAIKIS